MPGHYRTGIQHECFDESCRGTHRQQRGQAVRTGHDAGQDSHTTIVRLTGKGQVVCQAAYDLGRRKMFAELVVHGESGQEDEDVFLCHGRMFSWSAL